MQVKKTMLASDNASGVHPEVLDWLQRVNAGHALGYGGDDWTRQAEQCFQRQFGSDAAVLLVTTGTAANVLALQALAQSVDTVFCADKAHLAVDECGAPERMIGCKLVGVAGQEGKIDPHALAEAVAFQTGLVHRNRPRVLSLSQATEYGTLYQVDELRALVDFAHGQGMKVHMDGARLANAAAALDVPLAALTRDLGVDLLSLGGTKNGLMMAEAIVAFDPELATLLPAIRKQGMQLVSKQRYLAAQYLAYFQDDLWLRNARHANRMAARLAAGLARLDGVRLRMPVQANMVFACLPAHWIAPLQQHTYFNVWNSATGEVRFVTSFDTTEAGIDGFVAEIARLNHQETPI
ncbi:threonine aldolase family protein [Castellaniella hirudinis]|uniref:threonine aldolase family protein n=1 Tax=Castellaniella hirudinis TaxID=1144617 RepID=UPI0039C42EDA